MLTVALLVALAAALLFALELLSAFYGAMLRGHVSTLKARSGGSGLLGLLLVPVVLVRVGVVTAMWAMRTVALWFHEIAHAVAQFCGLGMPRIVMCRGGGYAQARPWPVGRPGRLAMLLGHGLLATVIAMAPLLFGAALIGAVIALTTGLDAGALGTWLDTLVAGARPDALRELPALGLDLGRALVGGIVGGGAVAMAAVFAVSLAIVSGMTPSSTDFGTVRYHLPAHGVAVVAAAALLERRPGAALLLVGCGVGALALFAVLRRRKRAWPDLLGGAAAVWLAVGIPGALGALGAQPVHGVQRAVAGLVTLLGVALTTYLFFLALMVALSLVMLRVRPLWEGLKAVPAEVRSVFLPIAMCQERRMMFQDTCDFCQCTVAQFKRTGCGGTGLKQARPFSWLRPGQRGGASRR